MPDKTWEELLIWKLTGPRFDEHRGVDLADLAGLVGLRVAIVEVAKILWRYRHRRKKIPDFAAESIDLRIKRFDDGSEKATVWLGRPEAARQPQGDLFGAASDFASFFDSIHEAAWVLQDALRRAAANEPQLRWLPREVLRQLSITGKSLRDDEEWSIQVFRTPELATSGNDYQLPEPETLDAGGSDSVHPDEGTEVEPELDFTAPEGTDAPETGDPPEIARAVSLPIAAYRAGLERSPPFVRTTSPVPTSSPLWTPQLVSPANATVRATLETLGQPKPPELRVVQRTMSGEVTMVDVDGLAGGHFGKVRIRPDGHPGDAVEIEFLPEHEKYVTGALDKHNNKVRLRVRGDAHLDERGKLKRFTAKRVAEIKAPDPEALSEEFFERLARADPERLLALLRPGELDPVLLTFAAEIAGRSLPGELVVPPLIALLCHEKAFVREGALYGLQDHPGEHVTAEVRRLAESDTSPGIRLVAKGVLKAR
jgi:hypothetical protein